MVKILTFLSLPHNKNWMRQSPARTDVDDGERQRGDEEGEADGEQHDGEARAALVRRAAALEAAARAARGPAPARRGAASAPAPGRRHLVPRSVRQDHLRGRETKHGSSGNLRWGQGHTKTGLI